MKSNEIWLEGQELEISKYKKLYKVYGITWGGDGTTTFKVPDFRNRVIWGSGDGSFGYIEAGLPNITGSFWSLPSRNGNSGADGAFTVQSNGSFCSDGGIDSRKVYFNASRSSSIYGNSNTVQPPAIKLRIKTRVS